MHGDSSLQSLFTTGSAQRSEAIYQRLVALLADVEQHLAEDIAYCSLPAQSGHQSDHLAWLDEEIRHVDMRRREGSEHQALLAGARCAIRDGREKVWAAAFAQGQTSLLEELWQQHRACGGEPALQEDLDHLLEIAGIMHEEQFREPEESQRTTGPDVQARQILEDRVRALEAERAVHERMRTEEREQLGEHLKHLEQLRKDQELAQQNLQRELDELEREHQAQSLQLQVQHDVMKSQLSAFNTATAQTGPAAPPVAAGESQQRASSDASLRHSQGSQEPEERASTNGLRSLRATRTRLGRLSRERKRAPAARPRAATAPVRGYDEDWTENAGHCSIHLAAFSPSYKGGDQERKATQYCHSTSSEGDSESEATNRKEMEDFEDAVGLPQDYIHVLRTVESSGWDAMEFDRNYTLLHWAAKNNRAELCARLLFMRADPNLPEDGTGMTAIDYAQHAPDALAALLAGRPAEAPVGFGLVRSSRKRGTIAVTAHCVGRTASPV